MSEEKKESKCCGCCEKKNKELSNENLDKVSGGTELHEKGLDAHLVNGKYICKTWKIDEGYFKGSICKANKTVDGVENVCTCKDKTNGICCRVNPNTTCRYWNKTDKSCFKSLLI